MSETPFLPCPHSLPGANIKVLGVGGAGCNAEVDGAYFGGHVRPENRKADRKDLRLAENRSDKRQCVVVVRERPADGAIPGRRSRLPQPRAR